MERVRDLSELPKAHLHLHFTGSMRPTTVLELADKYGVRLPEALTEALTSGEPPRLRATDERGWFRFQRLYDAARSCLREPEDIQRLVREAAEEDLRTAPAGWRSRSTRPRTRPGWAGSSPPWRSSWTRWTRPCGRPGSGCASWWPRTA